MVVFVGELVRCARACTHLDDFAAKTWGLVQKLNTIFHGQVVETCMVEVLCFSCLIDPKIWSNILDLQTMDVGDEVGCLTH